MSVIVRAPFHVKGSTSVGSDEPRDEKVGVEADPKEEKNEKRDDADGGAASPKGQPSDERAAGPGGGPGGWRSLPSGDQVRVRGLDQRVELLILNVC